MYVKAGLVEGAASGGAGYTTKEFSGYNARLSSPVVAFFRAEDM
jgi:hypothetical protein